MYDLFQVQPFTFYTALHLTFVLVPSAIRATFLAFPIPNLPILFLYTSFIFQQPPGWIFFTPSKF